MPNYAPGPTLFVARIITLMIREPFFRWVILFGVLGLGIIMFLLFRGPWILMIIFPVIAIVIVICFEVMEALIDMNYLD